MSMVLRIDLDDCETDYGETVASVIRDEIENQIRAEVKRAMKVVREQVRKDFENRVLKEIAAAVGDAELKIKEVLESAHL